MLTAALLPDSDAIAVLACAVTIEGLLSQRCWHKRVFNASQFTLSGAVVFSLYGGGRPDSARSVVALALAGLAAAAVTNGMTWAIVHLTQGMRASEWRESALSGINLAVVAVSVGVLAATMSDRPWLLAFLGIPIIGVILAGTARTRSNEIADQSTALLEAAIDAAAASDVEALERTLLAHAHAISHTTARFTAEPQEDCISLGVPSSLRTERWLCVGLDVGNPSPWSIEPALRTLLAIVASAAESLALRMQLSEQATTDELTGLRNRRSFDQHLVIADARARSGDGSGGFTLLFLDLDRFKLINDTLGHDVGDDLLRAVAARLVDAVRPEDVVFRLAGDEFVVIVDGVTEPSSAAPLVASVQESMSRRFSAVGDLEVQVSVGAAAWHDGISDPWELVKAADELMYDHKARTRA